MVQFGVCREAAPDFGETEMRLADAIRPWLARSYSAAVLRSWTELRPEALLEASPLSLTMRQREILRWTMAGKSNELIGDIIGRSAETVKNHLRAVYRRLGVHSRIEAALKVARTAPSHIRAGNTEVVAWESGPAPAPPDPARQGPISRPPARRSRSPRHSRSSPP
jgi:DNA-binding CsgD family transcriptional regulator